MKKKRIVLVFVILFIAVTVRLCCIPANRSVLDDCNVFFDKLNKIYCDATDKSLDEGERRDSIQAFISEILNIGNYSLTWDEFLRPAFWEKYDNLEVIQVPGIDVALLTGYYPDGITYGLSDGKIGLLMFRTENGLDAVNLTEQSDVSYNRMNLYNIENGIMIEVCGIMSSHNPEVKCMQYWIYTENGVLAPDITYSASSHFLCSQLSDEFEWWYFKQDEKLICEVNKENNKINIWPGYQTDVLLENGEISIFATNGNQEKIVTGSYSIFPDGTVEFVV